MFDKYPEFIELDPRTKRKPTRSYAMDKEFAHRRFHGFFQHVDLRGKSVLDLGCCTGALGAYVLEQGAAYYHGVEYDKELADIAYDTLDKYFADKYFVINQMFMEDFFKRNDQRFDYIVASGVIYAYYNPSELLDQLVSISDNIIIESRHPVKRWLKEMYGIEMKQEELEKLPLVVYYPNKKASMMYSNKTANVRFNGSAPTKGFIDYYMDMLGYKCDSNVYQTSKAMNPHVYNSTKRFACMYTKQSRTTQARGFKDAIQRKDHRVTKYMT